MMNLPNDIVHNILSYVDSYEDKRKEVFHQIKMNKVLTELKKRNEIYYYNFLYITNIASYFEFDILHDYSDEEELEEIIYNIPNDIMDIKSYLDEPYKKWNIDCGDYIIITNDFANHVEYQKKYEPNIVTELLQLKSNYLYNFIDEDIQETVTAIINHH